MKTYYLDIDGVYVDIVRSDNLKYLKTLKSNSIGVCVTDPPYLISFMHSAKHRWDKDSNAHDVELWQEIYRVLKPGAFVLSFAATRTYYKLCLALENAGFVCKEMFVWCYASGMPKGVNVSKAIDKHLGKKQKIIGEKCTPDGKPYSARKKTFQTSGSNDGYKRPSDINARTELTAPNTKQAKKYDGYFSGIKPAIEPIACFQKPISESTIVKNILKWGVGAYNVDACRIKISLEETKKLNNMTGFGQNNYTRKKTKETFMRGTEKSQKYSANKGRFPTNVYLEDHEEIKSLFPYTKSGAISTKMKRKSENKIYGKDLSKVGNSITLEDRKASEGSASRFFFQAKANKQDRNGSKHITVKPIKLLQELVKLVTPIGETVLDPFAGSGTTGYAAYKLGFDSIMIEQSKEYVEDIKNRFRPHMR